MPFGLVIVLSVFQRCINNVFRPLLESGRILLYVDDVLITPKNLQENLEILGEVIDVMAKNGLELCLDKCDFGICEIDYMYGYTVSEQGVKPCRIHVQTILNYSIPSDVRAVQRFLGLAGYFRKIVSHLSLIMKPLYTLVRKGV